MHSVMLKFPSSVADEDGFMQKVQHPANLVQGPDVELERGPAVLVAVADWL